MHRDRMADEASELHNQANELETIVTALDAAISQGATKGDAIFDVLRAHMLQKIETSRIRAESLYEAIQFME